MAICDGRLDDRHSRSYRFLLSPQGSAHGPGVIAKLGHFDIEHSAVARKDVFLCDSVHFVEIKTFERFDETAAEDNNFGAKHVDEVHDGIADGLGGLAHDVLDRFIAIADGSSEYFAADLRNIGADRTQQIGGFSAVGELVHSAAIASRLASLSSVPGISTPLVRLVEAIFVWPISMQEDRRPRRIWPS